MNSMSHLTQTELMALWNLIDRELEDQDGKYGRNADYAALNRSRKKIIAMYRSQQKRQSSNA
jgi:hypothetical protein